LRWEKQSRVKTGSAAGGKPPGAVASASLIKLKTPLLKDLAKNEEFAAVVPE
jgi:hypothetical protein